ncbi:MAG: hypothetical protein JOZ81_12495 [Chloroflexi bacterium]|nr:hypothetical protein [Chloroflexota bacterium]
MSGGFVRNVKTGVAYDLADKLMKWIDTSERWFERADRELEARKHAESGSFEAVIAQIAAGSALHGEPSGNGEHHG